MHRCHAQMKKLLSRLPCRNALTLKQHRHEYDREYFVEPSVRAATLALVLTLARTTLCPKGLLLHHLRQRSVLACDNTRTHHKHGVCCTHVRTQCLVHVLPQTGLEHGHPGTMLQTQRLHVHHRPCMHICRALPHGRHVIHSETATGVDVPGCIGLGSHTAVLRAAIGPLCCCLLSYVSNPFPVSCIGDLTCDRTYYCHRPRLYNPGISPPYRRWRGPWYGAWHASVVRCCACRSHRQLLTPQRCKACGLLLQVSG